MSDDTSNTDALRYDVWIEEALLAVIRRTLQYAVDNGLPGKHHFYVTFATTADGVVIPDRIRAEHPLEMTIVLEHQFWDLTLEDDVLSVTLSFGGRKERLIVPLAAVSAFADPSVNFGLQLKMADQTAGFGGGNGGDADDSVEIDLVKELESRDELEAPMPLPASRRGSNTGPKKRETQPTGEVIALDAFRKK